MIDDIGPNSGSEFGAPAHANHLAEQLPFSDREERRGGGMSHPHDPFRLGSVEVREFERKSAEVGRTTALMLRAIGEQLTRELKAIGDLHRADLARRRTATASEGPT